jgi:NAD(P)H-dependent FMN reductase
MVVSRLRGCRILGRQGKEDTFFSNKRTKKLLRLGVCAPPSARAKMQKSFASFLQKKRSSLLPYTEKAPTVTPPLIVGLGGALRGNSSTEKALRLVLAEAETLGARTLLLTGEALNLPLYAPGERARSAAATAGGWPGAVNTLGALRDIVHALRGWPTPLGVAINTSDGVFDANGGCTDAKIAAMLKTVAQEILHFAKC